MSIFKRLLSALFALVVTFTPSGDKNTVPNVMEHVHKYAETVAYAICTDQGYTVYTCACGETYTDNFVDPLGHSYSEAVTQKATCTEQGIKTFTCTECGDAYTETISALGHKYKDTVTKPSCGQMGYTTHTCTECGDSYVDSEVPALEHYYSRTDYQEETCTEAGYKIFTCDHCGDSYKTILAPYHPSDRVWYEPTCEEEGYYFYTCVICGYTHKGDFVPAVGHSYEASVTAPTCEEGGYTAYTCTSCGDSYIDNETDATGHSFVETITREPTQCMTGEKTFTCETCGYSYCEEIEVENKHSYVQVSVTEPTCTTEGIARYECEFCTDWYTEAIPVNENNHNYTATVTEPTCISTGYTTHTCACGDSFTDSETEAIGHAWGDWIVTKEADEDVEGAQERTCNTCGEVETEVIPEIHYHSFVVTSQTEPTCTENGKIFRACACGETNYTSVEEALGHSWKSHYQAEVGHYEAYIYCHCGNWCYRVADGNYDLAFADHVDADHNGEWWDWSYYSRNIWVVDVPGYNNKVCTRCGEEK